MPIDMERQHGKYHEKQTHEDDGSHHHPVLLPLPLFILVLYPRKEFGNLPRTQFAVEGQCILHTMVSAVFERPVHVSHVEDILGNEIQ